MNNFSNSISKTASNALYKSFGWMSLGIGLTTILSYLLSQTAFIYYFLNTSFYGTFFRLTIFAFNIGLGLFIMLKGMNKSTSYSTLLSIFILFSLVNGCSLCWIYYMYELESLFLILGITSIMFLGLASYGFTTKKDLSPMATFFVMLSIGILAFAFINLFIVKSILFSKTISLVCIITTSFFTAYDVQKIKKYLSELSYDKEAQDKLSIIGAYLLYQNFISLFIHLLHLLGNKKRK